MGLSTIKIMKNIKDDSKLVYMSEKNIRKLQEVLFDMIIDFDSFCQKYDIEYSLSGGSVLGAIRNNGFIPWDDDMDLNMTRENYDKMRLYFEEELGNKYWLHTPESTHNYGLCVPQLRKKGTIYRSRGDLDNDECGVVIDIFIIENTYDDIIRRSLHGFFSLSFGLALSCRNFYKDKKMYHKLNVSKKNRIIFDIKIILGFLLSFLSIDTWTHIWNKVNSICQNNKSRLVTIPAGIKHFYGELYERDKVCPIIKHSFAFENKDIQLPIMIGYDYYLTKHYGDYMHIPDKEDIETHVLFEFKI